MLKNDTHNIISINYLIGGPVVDVLDPLAVGEHDVAGDGRAVARPRRVDGHGQPRDEERLVAVDGDLHVDGRLGEAARLRADLEARAQLAEGVAYGGKTNIN